MSAGRTHQRPKPRQQPTYFVDAKKGEVNELRQLLRNKDVMSVPRRKLDVIKKVIAYMTLGIDVSRLFSEMIMASSSKDIVVKKMVYQYICHYAEVNESLAILCINTLRNDCKDDDPVIRGLALRALSGMRLESIVEYLQEPLLQMLRDQSPYVRKTAVMAVLKMYHVSPEHVTGEGRGLVDTLYDMICDRDPVVVTNAIVALTEIMQKGDDESGGGGIAINQQIIHHLLKRIKTFNEWGQCIVLNLVCKYKPASQQEMFDIMNLLDGCLQVANSAVVLAAAKCFLSIGRLLGGSFVRQIYERLRQPLLTLLSVPSFEIDFTVLSHIRTLVSRKKCQGVFDNEFKQFFCRYNEPTCVKYIKLDILPQLANRTNMMEIISELSEYVSDVDQELSRKAVVAIGDIGVKIEQACNKVIEQLLEFTELESFVRSATVSVLKDILRKYPTRAPEVIPTISKTLGNIDDPSGKAAVVWMIGEYGEMLEGGPYILEKLVDGFKEEGSTTVRLEILTAAMKLFFKRPPECQKMLGRVIHCILNEERPDSDLQDRALFYYRLLKEDVEAAKDIVNCPKGVIAAFLDSADNSESKSRIFAEFNTLSIAYNMPSEQFILPENRLDVVHDEGDDDDDDDADDDVDGEGSDSNAVSQDMGMGLDMGMNNEGGVEDSALEESNGILGDLLGGGGGGGGDSDGSGEFNSNAGDMLGGGLDDLLGGSVGGSEVRTARASSGNDLLGDWGGDLLGGDGGDGLGSSSSISLRNRPKISGGLFQSKWGKPSSETVLKLRLSEPGKLLRVLKDASVMTMATGKQGNLSKYYMYAQADSEESYFLVEVLVNPNNGDFQATIKSDGPTATEFSEFMKNLLSSITA